MDPEWTTLDRYQQKLERAGSEAGLGRKAPRITLSPMTRPRVTRADRSVFERLGRANEAIRDEVPPQSMREVFDRMEAIRAALGRWSEPGLPPDDDRAIAELLRIREKFLAKGRRGA